MTRLAPLALFAVALLIASGCGVDKTKVANDYVAATNQVVTNFETTFTTLQANFTATSTPKQDVDTLDQFDDAVQIAVRNLRAIKPPSSVTALHGRLIAAVGGYTKVIDAAKTGFAADDARVVIAARTKFSSSLTAVTSKITAQILAINRKLRS